MTTVRHSVSVDLRIAVPFESIQSRIQIFEYIWTQVMSKKRKLNEEVSVFQDKWTSGYFFVPSKDIQGDAKMIAFEI